MLKIINNFSVFFEDCYSELGVREYARLIKMSAPTASKMLKGFVKEGLLMSREERGFLLFRTNRESAVMKDLSRIYWKEKLAKIIEHINEELYSPTIVLFGSLSRLEATKNSDIDLAVFTDIKKELNFEKYVKSYGREIQFFRFSALDKINKELRFSILEGYLIRGVWK